MMSDSPIVLIVDDEPDLVAPLEYALQREGFQTRTTDVPIDGPNEITVWLDRPGQLVRKITEDPAPLTTDSGLEPVVYQLLSKNVEDRPATGREVTRLLDEAFPAGGRPPMPGATVTLDPAPSTGSKPAECMVAPTLDKTPAAGDDAPEGTNLGWMLAAALLLVVALAAAWGLSPGG